MDAFTAIAGHGVQARVGDHAVILGNAKLMADEAIRLGDLESQSATLVEQGRTPMFVAIDGKLAVADAIKPGARTAVQPCSTSGSKW